MDLPLASKHRLEAWMMKCLTHRLAFNITQCQFEARSFASLLFIVQCSILITLSLSSSLLKCNACLVRLCNGEAECAVHIQIPVIQEKWRNDIAVSGPVAPALAFEIIDLFCIVKVNLSGHVDLTSTYYVHTYFIHCRWNACGLLAYSPTICQACMLSILTQSHLTASHLPLWSARQTSLDKCVMPSVRQYNGGLTEEWHWLETASSTSDALQGCLHSVLHECITDACHTKCCCEGHIPGLYVRSASAYV